MGGTRILPVQTVFDPVLKPAAEGAALLRRALDIEIGRLELLRARAWIGLALVVVAASAAVFFLLNRGVGIAGLITGAVLIAWFGLGAFVLLPRQRLRLFYTWVTLLVEAAAPWMFHALIAVFAGAELALREWGPLMLWSGTLILGILRLSPRAVIATGVVGAALFAASTMVLVLPRAGGVVDPLLGPVGQLVRGMACMLGSVSCAFVARGLRSAVGGVVRTLRQADLFGKYRIDGELGKGGMGVVYRATYCPEGGFMRDAAVKLVHSHLAQNPDLVEKFRIEAALGARLVHDHIVQVFDFGKVDETYFFAMEFVDGVTLQQVLKRAAAAGVRIPPEVAAAIGKGVLEGLQFAHNEARDADGQLLRVVHRDLSPQNVLVSTGGMAKISDFGIARALRDNPAAHTEHIAGHLDHMAPEQVNAEPLDARCDLFVAGTLLWEMLCGEALWRRPTEAGIMHAILTQPAPAPSTIIPDLKPWDAFFDKALQKRRELRFQSAREMIEAMRAIVGDVDPDATRRFLLTLPPLPPSGARFIRADTTADVLPNAVSAPPTTPMTPAQRGPPSDRVEDDDTTINEQTIAAPRRPPGDGG